MFLNSVAQQPQTPQARWARVLEDFGIGCPQKKIYLCEPSRTPRVIRVLLADALHTWGVGDA